MKYKMIRFDGEDFMDTYGIATSIDMPLTLPKQMDKTQIGRLVEDVALMLSSYWFGGQVKHDELEEVLEANQLHLFGIKNAKDETFKVKVCGYFEIEKK